MEIHVAKIKLYWLLFFNSQKRGVPYGSTVPKKVGYLIPIQTLEMMRMTNIAVLLSDKQ